MLHVVGNSHVCFFTGTNTLRGITWWKLKPKDTIPDIRTYHIGPVTAWQFTEKYLGAIPLLPVNEGEKIMVVLGEVDCRYQIPLHSQGLVDANENVKETLRRMFAGIRILKTKYEVSVWGVHPSNRVVTDNELLVGNCAFRTAIARMWNERAAAACDMMGIPFFCIFNKLLAPDGLLDHKYLIDDLHISQLAMPFALEELNGYHSA